MSKRDGQQKGPQEHAEGQHGERTHERFLEQIHQPMNRSADDALDADERHAEEVARRTDDDRSENEQDGKNGEFNRKRS